LSCGQFVRKLLHESYLFRCSEELHVSDGLLDIVGHFVKTRMVVTLAKGSINTDEIVDALFLTTVLPLTPYGEGMAESDHEQSNECRDKNL